jgi:hypothetical protein
MKALTKEGVVSAVNEESALKTIFFCLLFFEGKFTSFFKD